MRHAELDIEAASLLLRHAPATALVRLAKLLRSPTSSQEALSVALDQALAEGPAPASAHRWRGRGKRVYAPILNVHGAAQPRYGEVLVCLRGDEVVGRGDVRAVARAWACDLAERVCRELDDADDPRSVASIAAARGHDEGAEDDALERAREASKTAAFERPLPDPKIAARTIALNATLEDAWDAAWYVAQCGAGWAQRDVTALTDHLGKKDPTALSEALRVVMSAQWMQLARDIEVRVARALGC